MIRAFLVLMLISSCAHGIPRGAFHRQMAGARGLRDVAPWTPAEIEDLSLWFDASDASTFSNVDIDGVQHIAEWRDKSGNNFHALPLDGENHRKPTIVDNYFGDMPAVRFLNEQEMVISSNYVFSLNQVTSASVHRYLSFSGITGNWAFWHWDSDASLRYWPWQIDGNTSNEGYFVRVGTTQTKIASTGARFASTIGVVRHGNDTVTGRRDGSLVGSAIRTPTGDISQHHLGRSNEINVRIGEYVMYSRPLQDSEIEQLEGYLAHKWGLAGNLPANHPYKDSPPIK